MAEVARMFNVSEQTANDWRKRKANPLRAARIGKKYYTTREHIQAFSKQPDEEPAPVQMSHLEMMVERVLARHGLAESQIG